MTYANDRLASHLAQDVARCRLNLEEAEQVLRLALDKADAADARIAAAVQQQQQITALRLAGQATSQDSAEFVLLAADIETLREIAKAAHSEAEAAFPEEQRNALREADQAWQRHQNTEHFNALSAQVAEVEALLCKVIGAAHQAGRKIGHHSLSQSWRPSTALSHAINHGKAPEA